jgi:transposase InsO family protein
MIPLAGSRPGLWVADITHISTWADFLDLGVVLDAFSRRVVAFSVLSINPSMYFPICATSSAI